MREALLWIKGMRVPVMRRHDRMSRKSQIDFVETAGESPRPTREIHQSKNQIDFWSVVLRGRDRQEFNQLHQSVLFRSRTVRNIARAWSTAAPRVIHLHLTTATCPGKLQFYCYSGFDGLGTSHIKIRIATTWSTSSSTWSGDN